MAISAYGNMVTTCSTQGSMIRVYSIPQGENLYTFTRGIKNTTQYSLSFSNDSSFLLSSSNTGTIHLFQLYKHANGHHSILKGVTDGNLSNVDDQLQEGAEKAAQREAKWFSFLVPKTCDDYLSAKKSDFFVNQIELQDKMNIVAMNLLNDTVYAFNCDGDFIEFKVDIA